MALEELKKAQVEDWGAAVRKKTWRLAGISQEDRTEDGQRQCSIGRRTKEGGGLDSQPKGGATTSKRLVQGCFQQIRPASGALQPNAAKSGKLWKKTSSRPFPRRKKRGEEEGKEGGAASRQGGGKQMRAAHPAASLAAPLGAGRRAARSHHA